jgi:hypothetical protein
MANRDFSHDSVARAKAALNTARAPLTPMIGQVLWLGAPIAFTDPGPTCTCPGDLSSAVPRMLQLPLPSPMRSGTTTLAISTARIDGWRPGCSRAGIVTLTS